LRAFHLNRQVFDRGFAELAAEAGATIRNGVRVTGPLSSGGVLIEDGPVRAWVTVFADGMDSAVRTIMPTMRNPWEVAWGLAQLLEYPGLGQSRYCEVRFGSFAPGWRAQLNPLGGSHASLWTFVRGVSRGELEGYAERARRCFLGAADTRVLEERRGADPAFVVPYHIADDGVMACGAAAGQGGLEYGARAGLVAGEVAAKAVGARNASRRALRQYERTWRWETAAEDLLMRWGMQALRHLSDTELDELFKGLSGVEIGERELLALLRGDPRGALRRVRLGHSVRALLRLALGWVRAAGVSEGRRV
jgi:flavin-dependent dehydrogenase